MFVAIASAPKRGKRGKRLTTRNAQLTVYPAFLRARQGPARRWPQIQGGRRTAARAGGRPR